jgi:predicted amidohydrolase
MKLLRLTRRRFLRRSLVCACALACVLNTHALEREIVISVHQGPCLEGDFSANLQTARDVIAQALRRDSQFLLFPECFLSGYSDRAEVERGARAVNDPELQQFIGESASHEMVVLIGFARRSADGLYNSILVIHQGALLGIHDKIMLTPGDRDALGFKPGAAVPVFTAHGAKFGVMVCADTSYPHVAMSARWQGAEILFTPHNNAIDPSVVHDHLNWVRNCHIGLACQLRMVVARANTVKTVHAGQLGYGDSFILSPQGRPLAEAGLFKTGLITAAVTPALFQSPYVWGELEEAPAWLRAQVANLLTNFRRPSNETDLRYWLENMLIHHRFTPAEVSSATGLTLDEIDRATHRLGLAGKSTPPRAPGSPLRVLPYPGGRHPRIGFLEGAVAPQRETKISVFSPWDDSSYVVADVPEAIWSNLGLTYLAHSHIDTLWTRQGITLPPLEWNRREDGSLDFERTLPNGIAFGTRVVAHPDAVRMETWLRNGTAETLTQLRLQNCVMLKSAPEFAAQTDSNKILSGPYAVCRAADGRRWVITAWDPLEATWQNPPLPCMHSNGRLADCPPGQTVRAVGWLSFYEGTDLEAELDRIDRSGWRKNRSNTEK